MTTDDTTGSIRFRCIIGLHKWRSVGLMNAFHQYALRCSLCGRTEVRQG